MNTIEIARQLGAAIQEDESYKTFVVAKANNDNDTELQKMIMNFNELRRELNMEMSKADKDGDAMTRLDAEIKELYGNIMARQSMVEYNAAREDLDKLLSSVNYIITMAANGEDPMTCPSEPPQGCSGSCSSCAGCH